MYDDVLVRGTARSTGCVCRSDDWGVNKRLVDSSSSLTRKQVNESGIRRGSFKEIDVQRPRLLNELVPERNEGEKWMNKRKKGSGG